MKATTRYIAGVFCGAVTAALLFGTITALGTNRRFLGAASNAAVFAAFLCLWAVPIALIILRKALRTRLSLSRVTIGLATAPIAYFMMLLMWRVLALIGDDIDMAGSTLWTDLRFAIVRVPVLTLAWLATFAVAAAVMSPVWRAVLPPQPRLQ